MNEVIVDYFAVSVDFVKDLDGYSGVPLFMIKNLQVVIKDNNYDFVANKVYLVKKMRF